MFDDNGVGIIHENEPVQAFFVGSDVCEIVDVINNPSEATKAHNKRILKTDLFYQLPINELSRLINDFAHLSGNFINDKKLHKQILSFNEDDIKKYIKNNVFTTIVARICENFSEDFQTWLFYNVGELTNIYISNIVAKKIILNDTNKFLEKVKKIKLNDDFFLDKEVKNKIIEVFENSNLDYYLYFLFEKLYSVQFIDNDFKSKLTNAIKLNNAFDDKEKYLEILS